jgi:hypothetical protein
MNTSNTDAMRERFSRVSSGFDYSFSQGIYVFGEYHFNGAGASSADGYEALQAERAYQEGVVYLLGRHYLAPGASYPWTPLLTASLQALVNLTDGSASLTPRLEYSFEQDVVVEAGAFLGVGTSPETDALGTLRFRSEFGGSDLYFVAVRLYF